MEALNQLAAEDGRQNCECAAEDAEISDRLRGEMQFIRLFEEKRRAKSGREIKQRNKQKCHPKVFRPDDGFQLLAGVVKNHATALLSGTLLLQENISDWKDRKSESGIRSRCPNESSGCQQSAERSLNQPAEVKHEHSQCSQAARRTHALPCLYEKGSGDCRGHHHEQVHHHCTQKQRPIRVRKKIHANPAQGGQYRAEQQIVPPACPEKWKRVGEDACKRLQIPRQPAPKEELRHLLASDVHVILKEELQRQLSQRLRLRHRRGENAEDDDESHREQIAILDLCPGVGGFSGFAHDFTVVQRSCN